jgi:Cu2+-exporting ATPase
MSEGKGAGRGESLIGVLLADEGGPIAWFGVEDAIREEAATVLAQLARRGLALEMSSGDPSPAAREVAVALGLEVDSIGATPEAKVARVRALQSEGERVVVVGDGVNDAPLLRAGDASIAMGSGCDLSRLGADAVLMQDDLTLLPRAVDGARRLRRIMRQNFTWAIAYNLVALPLAVSGQLSPWLAALGMSTSSLVVVLNALRLNRLPESA